MRKVVSLLLVLVFLLAFSSVAFAFSANSDAGFESSPVFTGSISSSDGGMIWSHTESPVSFHMSAGRMRIPPAQPGQNSADQSNVAVNPWNSDHSSVGDLP